MMRDLRMTSALLAGRRRTDTIVDDEIRRAGAFPMTSVRVLIAAPGAGRDHSGSGRGAGLAEPADPLHRAVSGRRLDRRRRPPHRRLSVARARPADRGGEQDRRQRQYRFRGRRQERARRLHGADRARPGGERAARVQGELRSVEGPGAGHPAVAAAGGAGGASQARRQLGRRADRAGEAAAGLELRDLGRRLAAAHGGASGSRRSPASSSSTCRIAAARRRSTISWPAMS